MRKFFNPDSFLWKPLGYIGELVTLSLMWAVCSIPVVTIGSASAALYDTVVHVLRRKEGSVSTLLWIGLSGAIVFFLYALQSLFPFFASHGALLLLLSILLFFFAFSVFCWVPPTLSRFTLSFRALQSVSMRLAFGHSLRSTAMALTCSIALYLSLRFVAPIFFLPGAAALLCSYLIEPVFRRYEDHQPENSQKEI